MEKKPGEIRYPHVYSPVSIRGKVYKNRLKAAPTMFVHANYFIPEISENLYRMVERRAAGGFACVSTGEMPLNFEEAKTIFQERKIDFEKFEGPDFEIAKEYADRIKAKGALCYFEFSHEGSRAEEAQEPWGPEDWVRDDGVFVKGMDRAMMDKVLNDYFIISRFAKECGFDGVLLHGGHGFQLQQFISPWTNHRTDEYGGSMENRARFPKEIIEACRRGIGEDGIIELRFSAEDGVPGGMTIDDTVEFCKLIDGMVDIIQVSNGLKWAGSQTKTFSSFLEPHGLNVEYAAKVKAAIKKSYVSTIGGFNSVAQAEEVIAAGKADFVEFGRQGFADPEMPNKTLEGNEDTVRRCVRCFHCYPGFCEHPTDIPLWEKLGPEEAMKIYSPAAMGSCAINPKTGFGFYPETLPAPKASRKVLIAGGGMGGCQAAITAMERGHQVLLCEKTDRLGGTINFTDQDEDKADLMHAKNVIIQDTLKCGAQIRLNTEVTKELIEKEQPDAIIIAIGAQPLVPDLAGIEYAMGAAEVYEKMNEIGNEVVIVGAGLIGSEVALHLANHGHRVTVVGRNPQIAKETFGYYRNALLTAMENRGIVMMPSTKCLEILKDGVRIEHEGNEQILSADTVLYALGMRPNEEAVSALKEAAGQIPVTVIGDALHEGKVADAVHSGYLAAMNII